jgi:hypothetical protein
MRRLFVVSMLAACGGSGGGSGSPDAAAPDAAVGSGRPWPDSSAQIRILADQLPPLDASQVAFVAAHFVGSQKLTLDQSQPIRAIAPDFLVLHYHLSIWQSAPGVDFIVDGRTWGNDYPDVTTHESWFWHNQAGSRVAAIDDGKLLMNLADPDFRDYWASSFAAQVTAGDYDAVFADSASPDLLQWEAQSPAEPRLAGTGARDTPIAEWNNQTYIAEWQDWIADLAHRLSVPLLPNTGSFTTSWDTTDYSLTPGAFVEGFADPSWSAADWARSTDQVMALANAGKILILQNYLASQGDVGKRVYYLANYLLVRGGKTYLDDFAASPLEWYPEWELDLGAATSAAANVNDLAMQGVYARRLERGWAVVNPGDVDVSITFPNAEKLATPSGGGDITTPGTIALGAPSTAATITAHGAAIFED